MKNWWKIAVVVVVIVAVVAIAQMKASKTEVASAAPAAAESVASLPAPPTPAPDAAAAPPPSSQTTPVYGPEPAPTPPTTGVKPGELSPPKPATVTKPSAPAGESTPPAAPAKPAGKPAAEKPKVLPRMLDLGSTTCIPCKMMVPVMDALKQEYAGKLTVEFINVNENQAAAEEYRIQSIPTQILFDKTGKEVFRHLGYWPKEELVAKCKELGLLS